MKKPFAHIARVNPDLYQMEAIKSPNQVCGREFSPQIANRTGVIVAVNGRIFGSGVGMMSNQAIF